MERDRFDFNKAIHLPYCGEEIMRVMLSDGVYQVGWADVPIGPNAMQFDSMDGVKVPIENRAGKPCGVIYLGLKKNSARVQTDLQVERTPIGSKNTDYEVGPSTSKESTVPSGTTTTPPDQSIPTPGSPVSPSGEMKSMRLRIVSATGLTLKDGSRPQRPYIMVEDASNKLRGGSAQGCTVDGDVKNYNQTFVMPIADPTEKVTVTVMDNAKMARDPTVGMATIVPNNFKRPIEVKNIPVLNSHGEQTGVLHLEAISSERTETVARVFVEDQDEPDFIKDRDADKHSENAAPVNPISVKAGCCRVRVTEGKGIERDAHPFIKTSWKKKSARTRTLTTTDPSGNRQWEDEFVLPCTPSADPSMVFVLQDNKKLHKDPILGTGEVNDLQSILNGDTPVEKVVTFRNTAGSAVGDVKMVFNPSKDAVSKLSCLPASEAVPEGTYNSVRVVAVCASNLVFGKGKDVCDPYLTVTHDKQTLKGKKHKNAGLNPILMETYTMPVRPNYPVEFTISDHDTLGKDVPIGTGKIALPDLTRKQREQIPVNVPLELNGKNTGMLNCHMTLLKEKVGAPAMEAANLKEYKGQNAQDLVEFEGLPAYNSLSARAINGRDLPLKDKADPHVEFGHGGGSVACSPHKNGGPNPTFPAEVATFPASNKAYLRVTAKSGTKEVGTGYAYLGDYFNEETTPVQAVAVPLASATGEPAGTVNVEIAVADKFCGQPTKTMGVLEGQVVNRSPEGISNASPGFEALDIEIVKIQDVPLPSKSANKTPSADPYVNVVLGNQKLRGHTVKKGNGSCTFGDVYRFPCQPVEFIKFEVQDDQKLHKDPVLASAKLATAPIMNNAKYAEVQRLKLPLFKPDGSEGGNLFMKVKGYADPVYEKASVVEGTGAGSAVSAVNDDASSHGATRSAINSPYKSMRVEILNSADIGVATADPYVVGRLGKNTLRTHTVEDGGHQAEFGDIFYFPYDGDRKLKLTLYNNRKMKRDEEFGYCKLDLDPVVEAGETSIVTGQLVNRKTGATGGSVTVIATPSTSVVPKAYAVSPEEDDEEVQVYGNHPAPCLELEDFSLRDQPASGSAGVGTKLAPYVICKLGKGKLRTSAPVRLEASTAGASVADFGEVMQFATAKAPVTLELKAVDNVKFHPDTTLGSASVDVTTFKQPEGAFEAPLLDKNGRPTGAKVTGRYLWSQENLGKKKCRVVMTPEAGLKFTASPKHNGTKYSSGLPSAGTAGAPESYQVEVMPTNVYRNSKPYAELHVGDQHLRFDTPFDSNAKVRETGFIGSGGESTGVLKVCDADQPEQQVTMQGVVDMAGIQEGDVRKLSIRCVGTGGKQEVELQVAGSDEPVSRPRIHEFGINTEQTKVTDQNARGILINVIACSTLKSGTSPTNSKSPTNIQSPVLSKSPGAYAQADLDVEKICPYITVHLGRHTLRGITNRQYDPNYPIMFDTFLLPYNGEAEMRVTVYNNIKLGKDTVIGSASVGMNQFMKTGTPREEQRVKIPIYDLNGNQAGALNCKIQATSELCEPHASERVRTDSPLRDPKKIAQTFPTKP
ncbi:C2 domain protein [Gregarina niphandrodes]|uniref:C2 domain protein n=1 Tax=Gregarina niphandrodes TaxID=110365 RepID=A0A023B6B1_GRENI|nr:C2 domain protein [Gregarina niphandrodes]EZG65891.1 C2 domain protein [Gregarina niphandrodes]|eukprot:XP_011134049.1 C2 domain protein [Gregarina niphandrodes]